MSYLPISGLVPQYADPATGLPYSGAVLKAYAKGTSNNISIATDVDGGTLATSVALNSGGFPVVSGSVIIPHLDQDYKLALYPTQAAADANSGAIWIPDKLPIIPLSGNFTATETGTGDAYEFALTGYTAHTAGIDVFFIASEANVGACTANPNFLGAKSIKLLDGSDPYDNAIVANMIVHLKYDGTNYQLMNPFGTVKSFSAASAVNEITVSRSATGNAPDISATGSDTNIDLQLTPKGNGRIVNSAAVANYVSGVTEYVEDDIGYEASSFNIVSNLTASSWESVGPTGSGADNIWATLDIVPDGVKWLELHISAEADGAVNGTLYYTQIKTRKAGSSTTPILQRVRAEFTNRSGASEKDVGDIIVKVPVDSLNRIDMYYITTAANPASWAYLVGWGI